MSSKESFTKSLSTPDAIPTEGIKRATQIMEGGLLFRYGELGSEELDVALLEKDYADYIGLPYVCGVNSGGCALFLALKAAGVQAGDSVLVNAFTLAPVPGSIDHAGAKPVLVDINKDYLIDLEDLRAKALSSGAKVLMLSHMRGHIADMNAVVAVCEDLGLTLIEDCAHTMGAKWQGKHVGTFGAVACFSTQTFKHINSGEGGLIATSDEDIAAKVVLNSGSYMLYEQNGARPSAKVFERWRGTMPNYSMRMSALVASVLRPQIPLIDERGVAWNERYAWLEEGLQDIPHLYLPKRVADEHFVASSLQFNLVDLDFAAMEAFQKACDARGIHLKWFGRERAIGFTSTHQNWEYISKGNADNLAGTDQVMTGLFDMRIPLSLTKEDCVLIAEVIGDSMLEVTTASNEIATKLAIAD